MPVEIDGADGGGQVVRTALAAAAVTGEPVRVESVRGDRPNPGLRPQHLAAVRALAAVADADVEGATEGSETLVFEPGTVRGGAVDVDVGTAGSVTLVCDALLPVAAALPEPLSVTVTGGTDVKWSPPVDYLDRVKLPLLAGAGLDAGVDVARRGFYPVGGGEVALTLAPWTPAPVPRGAAERGPVRSLSVRAVATDGLADAAVAERLAGAVAAGLGDDDAVARLVREAPPDRDVDLDPDELRAGLGDGGNEDVGAGADGPGSGPAVDAGVAVGTAVDYVEAASPGASVLLVVEHGDADGEGGATDGESFDGTGGDGNGDGDGDARHRHRGRAGFAAIGERGVPAERIAGDVVRGFADWAGGPAAVDAHLADQLLPFVALGGGRVRAPAVTDHLRTNAATLAAFGYELSIAETDDGVVVERD